MDITSIISSWSKFDFPSKLSVIDSTLQQSKDAQKQSAQARKQLGESTKQFKRCLKSAEQAATALGSNVSEETARSAVKSVETLSKECKVTIKRYQEEIDNITRRCKSSESAYASLAQALKDQSDPSAIMQEQQTQLNQLREQVQAQVKSAPTGAASAPTSSTSLDELISLRREVAEYEVEFRNLKNQDITIRKLEAKIEEMKTAGEEAMEEQLEKHKEELEEREGRRVAEVLEREATLERKVQTLELQMKAERAGREATQAHLLEADEGTSQREAAWEAQRRILVDDSTRLREELQTISRDRDELRLKVAAMEGGTSDSRTPPASGVNMRDLMAERKAYEAEVAELSETASLLRDELKMKDDQLNKEFEMNRRKVGDLEQKLNSANETIQTLDAQLAEAPNQAVMDSMRRELRILKRLEYNADDVDADRDPEIAGGSDEKDLEAVLVSKLRRAETDLVKERIAKTDLSQQMDSLKAELATAERAREEADKLVFSLEKDLERAIAAPVTPSSSKKKVVELPSDGAPSTLQTILDPEAPVSSKSEAPAPSTSAVEKAEDDHSVATIVMAQRDRLRARCEALEAERDSFKRELQVQVQSSESLKTDNTKLYEKVRYLQSFQKGPSGSSVV